MQKQYSGKKRLIQSYFYNKIPTKSNFVGLAGNNLDLHINDILPIIQTKRCKAYIYDIDKSVIDKFKYLECSKIELINSNILNCNIARCMDLDLMQSLSTIQGIVYYIFNSQYLKYSRESRENKSIINTFMFTYSLRNNKRNINDFINCLVQDKCKLNIKSIEIKRYFDTSAMCTVQIQYSCDNC